MVMHMVSWMSSHYNIKTFLLAILLPPAQCLLRTKGYAETIPYPSPQSSRGHECPCLFQLLPIVFQP